jgi:hypothetical protein
VAEINRQIVLKAVAVHSGVLKREVKYVRVREGER